MQIKELTIEQFRVLLREVVIEVLEEYIDLDEGKPLKISVWTLDKIKAQIG